MSNALPPFTFASRRSPVQARNGMAAASQPLAVEAALDMLRRGGTAADAAVATAAALAVLEPCSTGLGGDAFVLYYQAGTGQVLALNGSGRSPARLTLDLLRERGLDKGWPYNHALTVTVPGACAAWCDLHERLGRLELTTVLGPAARLAREGFPVGPVTAQLWERGAREQLGVSKGGAELLLDGRAPRPGDLMRNPTLARTLELVAEGGKGAFYQGEPAERIAATVREHGGVLDVEDMAAHESLWTEPVSTVYRETRVYECPPNGQGLVALLALNILSLLGPDRLGEPLSASWIHHGVEALRLAFADAVRWVADPDGRMPLAELLSMDFAAKRAGLVEPGKAMASPGPGQVDHSDTVYFCVVDGQGNACSMVNSTYMGFGTGIVPQGLGFSLQNRGYNFSLEPGHPNALGPSRRTYHTIIPGMAARRDGSLLCPFGVMGAFMQPQGHVQVLMGLLDQGLDPQAALDRPRFCVQADGTDQVLLEEGIDPGTAEALADMGHKVAMVKGYGRSVFGRGQVILRDPDTGLLCAGSDPRADGCAFGF